MGSTLGSGEVSYDPAKIIIHFGSPAGSTYAEPEPLAKP